MMHPLLYVVVPPATKPDPDDSADNIRIHPVPVPQRRVRQPVLVVDPVRPVRGVVERHQGRPVG